MRSFIFLTSLALGTLVSGRFATAESYDAGAANDAPAATAPCDPGDYECLAGCCECSDRLLGLLPSEHCFDRFISPLSNPFYFEDPRALTEVRGIFIDNSLPNTIGGGDAQVWATQFRGRLTENVSLIVPRLAYWQVNPAGGGAPVGFMSTPVGVKFNLLRDVDRQLIVSGGVAYFIPGASGSFTEFGDGDLHLFLSGGKQIFGHGHWLSGTGFRLPLDTNWGTQMWYWSNQWDYELSHHIYPLVGLNWYHWMRSSGVGLTGPITGLDLVNLPASGVAGRNVVTGAVGLKWKPRANMELGGGYEFPVTQNGDILRNRAYADLIIRY
jgi:hypothetical protein